MLFRSQHLVLAAAQRQPLRYMLQSGLVATIGRENIKASLASARKRAAEINSDTTPRCPPSK